MLPADRLSNSEPSDPGVQGALPLDFERKIIKLFSFKMSMDYYLLMMRPSQQSKLKFLRWSAWIGTFFAWIGSAQEISGWTHHLLSPPDFQTFLRPSTSTFYYSSFPPAPINLRGPAKPLRGWEEVSRPIRGEIWGKFWNFPNQTNIRTIGNLKYSIRW